MANFSIEQQNQYALEAARIPYQRAQQEEAANQEEAEQSKMGWGIFLGALLLSLIADIAEMTGVGIILTFIIDIILGFMLGFSKGAAKQWKKWIAGFLPIPLVRVALLTWAFLSSRSDILQKAQPILNVASKVPSPYQAQLKVAAKAVNAGVTAQNLQQRNG